MITETRRWWTAGEQHLGAVLQQLPDAEFDEPSLLRGWSRRTLLAHLARNADALGNLLSWARTGVETPMYRSSEQRSADIAASARQGAAALRADYAAAAERLQRAANELTDAQWQAPVRTAQGRPVPAGEVPWMRVREVWVHAVDLDAGATFADVPADIADALIDDVLAMWTRRGESVDIALVATDGDRRWRIGAGTHALRAPRAELLAMLTGRAPAPHAMSLPPWL